MLQRDDAPTASALDVSDTHEDAATASLGPALSLLPAAAGARGAGVDGDSREGGVWKPAAAASLWRRLRRPRRFLQEVAGGDGNSSCAELEDQNPNNSGTGRRRKMRAQHTRKQGDESHRRNRLRRLRALLKGSDVTSQVVSQVKATGGGNSNTGVWKGVFTSLSPTDTGGVLASLLWLLVLAVCILCCTENCQLGISNSLFENGIWIAAQTLASIILSYGSFLAAIALLALHQWRLAEALKARRLHVKLQRELMRRLRESIRKYSDETDSPEAEEPLQPEQAGQSDSKPQMSKKLLASSQSNDTGCHDSNPSNSVIAAAPPVVVETAAARRRRELQELVTMMKELEKLIATELQLMGLQLDDLQLLDRALGGPMRIGSVWLSANCRVSLYKAHGHTATAYAHLHRF